MGTAPVNKIMISMGVPMIISMVLQAVYNIVDSAFVSNMKNNGEAALNALTLAFPVQTLMIAFAVGTGVGVNALIARSLGANDKEQANKAAGNGLFLCTVLYIIFMLFGFFGTNIYVSSQTDDKLIMDMTNSYLRICCTVSLGVMYFGIYEKALQATGKSILSTIAQISGAVTNIILDPIMIYGLLGCPEMGVKGAALATILARVTELTIVVVWMHRHAESYPFVKGLLRSLYIPGRLLGRVIVKCIPLIINETSWAFGMTFLNQSYSTRGLDAVAGVNICSTLSNVFCVFFIAAGDAISIMIGQLLGADKKEEARASDRVLCTYSVLGSAAMGLIMAVCAPFYPLLYNTTGEVRRLATVMLLTSAAMLPFIAFTNAAYFTLRSGGNTFVTFLFDGAFMLCVVVPMSFLLTRFTGLPIIPVYMICQLSEVIKAAVGFVMVKRGVWVNNIVENMT